MASNLKQKLINLLPFRSKYWREKTKLAFSSLSLLLKKQQKVEKPIVLMSFPRSGSSWVGAILGSAPDTLYMREPVTTPYILSKPNRLSVFELEKCENWSEYQSSINNALNGSPKKLNSIVKYPSQWTTPNNSKRLLIKEVNPLVISEYLNKCDKVIYLVRHPFSIAKSYQALGWQSQDLFSQRFSQKQLAIILTLTPSLLSQNFYYQMGYLLGWIEARTKHLLKTDLLTIRYEDICLTPIEQYQQLFNQLNLSFTIATQQQIEQSLSASTTTDKGEFSLQRNQADVAKVNVSKSEEKTYSAMMNAYKKAFIDYNDHHETTILSAYDEQCSLINWTEASSQ